MSYEVEQILENWPSAGRTVRVAPVERRPGSLGFSGAAVWKVETPTESLALRQWQGRMPYALLRQIHEFQKLISATLDFVPRLALTHDGAAIFSADGRLWELSTWMPGAADYMPQRRPEKLRAAMQALAAIHLAARPAIAPKWKSGAELSDAMQRAMNQYGFPVGSPSMTIRFKRLEELLSNRLEKLRGAVAKLEGEERTLASKSLALVAQLAPQQRRLADKWKGIYLQSQPRLGDVHHDHILFTGDRVTGVIDFGAADFDAASGDVARLLGSLAGDDQETWDRGLSAYLEVNPLPDIEQQAIAVFDSTGVVISAANWLHWLFVEPTSVDRSVSREAAFGRLEQLTVRLQSLAGKA